MLLLTAFVWGFAFIFQSKAMDHVEPITLTCVRMFLGGAVLLPICFIMNKSLNSEVIHSTIKAGIVCGIVLGVASLIQQYGIANTSVEKSGFISALYIVIVPIFGILQGKRVNLFTWICIIIALAGFYLLSFTSDLSISIGDLLVFIAAIVYSLHIIVIDKFNNNNCDGLLMSCIQFLTAGILCFIPMLVFESPSVSSLLDAKLDVLYMGLISCGIGYTFQVLGQKRTPPVRASLILCLESFFAAVGGFFILHERLNPREISGCILLMTSVILINVFKAKAES